MKIWAHRGCSQRYPENTILSFEKAASIDGLEGIELDIQLSKDGQLVVIHDERVDRTTEGVGYVKDYTLAELKRFHIYADSNPAQEIPTMREVFELLKERMKAGLRLNIELKTGIIDYPGIEEKIADMVGEYNLGSQIVYSSFYAKTLERIHALQPEVEIGILDSKVSDCLWKAKGGCGATALHPFWRAIDLSKDELEGRAVRAWLTGHLYPEKPTGTKLDLSVYEKQGITDMFLNEPEMYL